MTNAEKFKEDFGFENDDTNTCPYKDCIDKDSEKYDSCDECIEAYWRSEYKGKPTIPLSVIEDIKYDVEKYFVDNIWAKKDDCSEGTKHFKAVLDIIDKVVKECEA